MTNRLALKKQPDFYRLVAALGLIMFVTGCSSSDSSTFVNSSTLTPAEDPSSGGLGAAPDAPSDALDSASFLITNNESSVYKVSPLTGKAQLLYSSEGDFDFVAPADVIEEVVYMTANDNTINAINITDGEFLWEVPLGAYTNPDFSDFPTAVVCDDDTCWARGSNGVLMSVSALDGSTKWSTSLHPNGGFEEELNGSELLIKGNRIYLTANKTGTTSSTDSVSPALYVINRDDGSVINRIDLNHGGYGVPRVVDNTLLVSTWGEILAFNATSYNLQWRISNPGLRYTKAQVVGNVVVAGAYDSNDHNIVGYELTSGTQLWSVPAGSSDNAYSSSTDGQLVYAMVGELYTSTYFTPGGEAAMAIDPANGSIVWINDGVSFVSNPLVALGRTYYGYYWDIHDQDLNTLPDGLSSLDALTGEVQWVNSTLETPGVDWFTNTPTLVHAGKVYRLSHSPDVIP